MTRDVSGLAVSVATVAIAGLSGGASAAAAVLGEGVQFLQHRHAQGAPQREVRERVRRAVESWARGEQMASEDVSLGMELAARVVAEHGALIGEIVSLHYDVRATTEMVWGRASISDTWGPEDRHAVARRCIEQTYAVLIEQIKENQPLLVAASEAMRADLAEAVADLQAQGQRRDERVAGLADSLVGLASIEEVRSYLRVRVRDWDVAGWFPGQGAPSALERPLRLRASGARSASEVGDLSEAEALQGQRMLVVLGDPGAGKTWLARRYARAAAQLALDQMEEGVPPDQVELPLLTRWQLWDHRQEVRAGLIEASFAAQLGHGDIGGGDTVERVRRTFERHQRVLVIVDGLDEAADQADQAASLRTLASLQGWRAIITSRPAAWDTTYAGAPPGPDSSTPRVAELQPLSYPDDVETFVRAWFAGEIERGAHLLSQLRERQELRRAASIPLVLTFFCILTGELDEAAELLPARRRDLYDRLTRKLLRGAWSSGGPGSDAAPDLQLCLDTLKTWAWHAVGHSNTATGLGNWGETFTQPAATPPGQARAIDHVAPKQMEKDFTITRAFVHRTVLEHLVAEHVADQDTAGAVDILLPHLWFDPDWLVAAPAAIAEHNRRHKGELLAKLLEAAGTTVPTPAHQEAVREIDVLLLSIAAESQREEWTQEHQDLIDAHRISTARSSPRQVAATAHWEEGARQGVLTVILEAVEVAGPADLEDLVDALLALDLAAPQRARARAVVMSALLAADGPFEAHVLAQALPSLATTKAERENALIAALAALPTATAWANGALLEVSLVLAASPDQREAVLDAALVELGRVGPWTARTLTVVLPALATAAEQPERVRAAVLAVLPTDDPWVLTCLARMLPALDPTESERGRMAQAVLAAVPEGGSRDVDALIAALPALATTGNERDDLRQTIASHLLEATPQMLAQWTQILIELKPTDAQHDRARAAVLRALPGAEPYEVHHLIGVLPALATTEGERAEVRAALVREIPAAELQSVKDLVKVLCDLARTDGEREEAHAALLAVQPQTNLLVIDHMVWGLTALATSELARAKNRALVMEEVRTAAPPVIRDLLNALVELASHASESEPVRAALLTLLADVQAGRVDGAFLDDLAEVLPAVAGTPVARREVHAAVIDALPGASPRVLSVLLGALLKLKPTASERRDVPAVVMAALPSAESWVVLALVDGLASLNPSPLERAKALERVLPILSEANPMSTYVSARVLLAVATTDEQQAQARAVVQQALSRSDSRQPKNMVSLLRALSPIEIWRKWLAGVPAHPGPEDP